MCVVSMVGDDWNKRIPDKFPWATPPYTPPHPAQDWFKQLPPDVSKEEFEALKKEVKALKKLLKAAKKYDKETGQPDCEVGDKVAFIKKIAEMVGVDISDVFQPD